VSGRMQPPSVLELMDQIARRPAAREEHAGEDDCPICRHIADHGDPTTRELVTLPDGTTLEIVALKR
jgi:hypothetical protein